MKIILKSVFIVFAAAFLLLRCEDLALAKKKEGLEASLLTVATNYNLDDTTFQSHLPEIYYTIMLDNNLSSPMYLINSNLEYEADTLKPNFRVMFRCKSTRVSLNLYNVTSPIVYLEPNTIDTINIKADFKEIIHGAEQCGFEKVADFIERLVQEGVIIYSVQSFNKEITKGGNQYVPVKSLSIPFGKKSVLETTR